MNLKKPKFWDLKKPNYLAYLLLPLTIFIKINIFISNLYPKKKFNKILPTNKLEQMCMERLFGIAFQQEGYDASNSIQGEHFTTPFETFNFQKKLLQNIF